MKRMNHWRFYSLAVALFILAGAGIGHTQLKAGQTAPLFVLPDTQGNRHELVELRNQPMVIVYFFDVVSPSSQEGLLHLDQLGKAYKDADLVVWSVTRSDKSKIKQFLSKTKLGFPVLLDKGDVSNLYAAKVVLPTVCIIGPDLKLLDYFQGGGKATENMLVTLAERELQRRHTIIAKALSDKVVEKNPGNARAKTVKGYAELKEGDLKAAEKTFYNLARSKGKGEILGKEGLSQVYVQKGEPAKAIKIAEEVERLDGRRAYTHVVRGDMLYSQNKTTEAEAEYRKAIKNAGGRSPSIAVAYNQLGRIYAIRGSYEKSRQMYDQAVALDPYFIEATSNKGIILERQGEWARALEAFRQAQAIDRDDPFAAALASHAQRKMLLEKDPDRRRRFEARVAAYVRRYEQSADLTPGSQQDAWTSGPTILTLFELHETGGLSQRDGFARFIKVQLYQQLKSSGRVQVIDPLVMEGAAKRLGLTEKDYRDDHTRQRLAKAFEARMIGRGSLFHLSEGTLIKLQFEDVQSPEMTMTVERQFASSATFKKDLHWLNREVLAAIMASYPLQAYVVEVTGNQVLINLGADQGVVMGSQFDVIEEKTPVHFKGKTFTPEPSVLASIEVVKVAADFAYAHIKSQRRSVRPEDKLRERVLIMGDADQPIW